MSLNKMDPLRHVLDCIFCDIMDGRRPGVLLYDDADLIVILDKYPIDTGHSLVIPRGHHERITDMDAGQVGAMFSKVPRIARAVLKGTGADAFSIAQNNGKAARQIIPHVHVHIIPRFSERGTVWTKRGIPDSDELERLAGMIRAHV